ncbi:MAG: HAD-IIIA family hydrolase [Bacilli bacterium]|nr:HAD-IIIA family hydrolase [Bacilli bacterium]
MRRRCIPFALAETIFEIPASFYQSLGVKAVLVDLDNTLDPYVVSDPTESPKKWKEALLGAGLRIVILSNNSGKRVSRYATELGVEHRCFMKKPFSGPLKRFLAQENLKPGEAILVGDQIMTDVQAANGAGVRCVLTEPLDPREPPWTKFNRLFDRPKRKKIKAKGLAPDWKEIVP